jgi:hypothetical protein
MPILPQYKLTYFNLMGRAEPIRLIFVQAGVQYKDHRIETKEWPALKLSSFSSFSISLAFTGGSKWSL